ncbi:MAG: asparaginase [Erysipelotrichaceae bacterium]|nr:asparaginase [Erysipelotrichaceae bacterium]
MKTIAIVATGGTIAGVGQAGKTVAYHAGEININQIIESIPMIKSLANIEEYQVLNVDSNEMNPSRWIALSRTINELLAKDDIDGVVVTHGTDTLDETAYYLTLTINSLKPVVITGAMRPASATSADGPFNLYEAVALAINDEAYGQGVMGVFSSTIYSGRDIQKVNNFKVDAFDQKALGCLGYMQDQDVYFYSKTFKKHTYLSRFSKNDIDTLPQVGIVYFYAGASSKILYDMASNHEGIIITGSGSGNYSQEWLKAIENLTNQGKVFVRCSRVTQGIIFNDEIFDPHHLCIPGNTLAPQKARVLLMLSLSQTHDIEEIRHIFNEY